LDDAEYEEVYPEGIHSKDPSPLKVKEVTVGGTRYIVCKNERQARRDEADRNTIVESLKEKIKKAPASLISNKGYRGFLTITNKSVALDEEKIKADVRYDGIWVLTTNTKLFRLICRDAKPELQFICILGRLVVFATTVKSQQPLVRRFTEGACFYIYEQGVDITPIVRSLERFPDTVKRISKNTVGIDVQGTEFFFRFQIERNSKLIFCQFSFDCSVLGKQNLTVA
jgi:hypothetical protein